MVFDFGPEVGLKVSVDGNKFNVQSERAEEVPDAPRKGFEELKKLMNMRSLKLSFDKEGEEEKGKVLCVSKWMMRDRDFGGLVVRNTQMTE